MKDLILDPLERSLPRSFCRCSECAFREPLQLPGWEQRSIWGFDNSLRSFFAKLWPNGSKSKKPEVFLPWDWYVFWWPCALALDLIAVTEMPPIPVCTALQLLDPDASLRRTDEIEAGLRAPPGVTDEYRDGYRRALHWVLGAEDTCPGSGREWTGGTPTPLAVNAEYELLLGHCYRQEVEEVNNQQFNGGGAAALRWALGGYELAAGL